MKTYVGKEAIPELIAFLHENRADYITLVSDENEYAALGQRVEEALREQEFKVNNIVLRGEEIGANERYVVQVLLPADLEERVYIAVGSGTLTDIVRFVSYRTRSFFISMPTAPSVDGFAASGSAMNIMDYKQTIQSRPPVAIFADLDTLCNAPRDLIAAGFGDMFGKYTALADWELANLLVDEPYDPEIAARSQAARDRCAQRAEVVEQDWEQDIQSVMEALIEEGLCMLVTDNSRPASGAEHQFSHFWEMRLLRENRPAIFHGTKVGLASILVAKYYEMIRELSKEQVVERLHKTKKFDPRQEIQKIREGYGDGIADSIIQAQSRHLNMTDQQYEDLKTLIVERWEDIQTIAKKVPPPSEIQALLNKVGGATHPESVGLTQRDVRDVIQYAMYVRKAFTILNVCQMMGLKLVI